MAEVSFLCKRTVVSTKVVEQGKYCSLSILDRVMQHNHLLLVFYYQTPPGLKAGDLTRKLRESVADVLCAFPIVTGRLVKTPEGHWMVKCNDAGMRMVEARVKGSLDEWLQTVNREKELQLVHWEPLSDKPYFWSTFCVQLSEFEEGGLAVGLSCSHLLADPTCATMFIKAWADITLTGRMVAPPMFHPLPPRRLNNRSTNHELIDHYSSTFQKPAPDLHVNFKTIALKFEDETVRGCITMAKTPDASHAPDPTPFQALAGLLWICISEVKGLDDGLIDMSLSLDRRRVLGLDKSFFGNCTIHNKVLGKGISESELPKAAAAIREVESRMDSEGIQDLIEWLEEGNKYEDPPWMHGYDLICANLEGVDAYSAIFEAVYKPIRVSYYIQPALGEGQLLILPSPSSESSSFSRVVMLTLPEDEAIKILGLQLIQQMSPIILMGFNNNSS